MDETLLGLMEIVGPIILLVILAWVVLRNRRGKGEAPMERDRARDTRRICRGRAVPPRGD